MVSALSIFAGRFLLGLYFILPGLLKVMAPEATIAYMQSHAIAFAPLLMWIAAATNILGGLLLMAGRHVKLVAYGFVVYVLLVNVMLHDFWTMTGDGVAHERQNFIKNLAILAGLLVLAGHAPARNPFTKDWWRGDSALRSR
ncbi:MAG: DoxX family protein [Alphaproteobacteria bacterium]